MDKLALIVPYRNRQEHLKEFIPYMVNYFKTTQKNVDLTIYVIEQGDDKLFNRGKLLNVGYDLAKGDCDYICFHDVDYIPVDADYSKPELPTRLIWKGLSKKEDYVWFFGAVVLFPKDIFVQVNGFSNGYQGWGFEDTDLHTRLVSCGISIERRDQEFKPLRHAPSEVDINGNLLPEVFSNKEKFLQKQKSKNKTNGDGLTTLEYKILYGPDPYALIKEYPVKVYLVAI